MDDASIRPATPEDAPEIQRVARSSWHAAHDDIIGADAVDTVIDEWYDTEDLAASVARDDATFLVACADDGPDDTDDADEILGFAQGVLGDEGEPAWLARIYLAPDHWGEGLGSELLGRVESWLREKEEKEKEKEAAERLRLAVMADNEVGNAFYEKHGYEVVAERDEEVFGAAFEEYVREKEL